MEKLWIVSKFLNSKEDRNQLLTDLIISSYRHFLFFFFLLSSFLTNHGCGDAIVNIPHCLKQNLLNQGCRNNHKCSQTTTQKSHLLNRRHGDASIQSTAWCLKYKSKNLPPLVLIDICYLQISNMCKMALFLFTAQTTD